MSLLLKSNIALNLKKLTSVVSDAITAYCDFRDSTYSLNNTTVSYSDIFNVIRSTVGGALTPDGTYNNIASNTGRVSFDLSRNKKGLLIEQIHTNEFYNSYAPASHSRNYTINVGSGVRVLSCVGSGKIELLIDGVSKGFATELKPLFYLPLAASTQVQFIVSGVLTYAAFYATIDSTERITRIQTGVSSTAVSQPDVIEVKPSLFSQLLNAGTGCIVMKISIPADVFNRNLTGAQSGTLLLYLDTSNYGIFAARSTGDQRGHFLRVLESAGATEKQAATNAPITKDLIVAVNVSPNSSKMAVNGKVSQAITHAAAITLAKMYIASGSVWSTGITNYLQELVFYNRNLDDSELALITTN